MTENFLAKAMQDGQVFVKLINLVTQLGRLKIQIRRKRTERDKLLKDVGIATIRVCHQANAINGQMIFDAVNKELYAIQEIDGDIVDLEGQIATLRSGFKAPPPAAPK